MPAWRHGVASYISSELAYPEPRDSVVSRSALNTDLFEDQLEVLQCDSVGGVYYFDIHGIRIVIPEGAVNEDSKANLEFGVTLHGPFEFPKDTKPVLAIISLNFHNQSSFSKSIEITLSHFINYTEESQFLAFYTANEKGERFQFQKLRSSG